MSNRRQRFDCIVIGGGHNGLVTAGYLARAGKSVCVLERRGVLGGCACTEEIWPGYKVSTAAYVISLFLPEITRELKLKHFGLEVLPRNPSSFTPLLDGRSLTLGPNTPDSQREIAKFSAKDADAYPRYNGLLERVAKVLEPVLNKSAPDALPLPKDWRKIGVGKRLRDGAKLLDLYQAFSGLAEDLPRGHRNSDGRGAPLFGAVVRGGSVARHTGHGCDHRRIPVYLCTRYGVRSLASRDGRGGRSSRAFGAMCAGGWEDLPTL